MKLLPANEIYTYDQNIKRAGCNRNPEVIKESMGISHYIKIKHCIWKKKPTINKVKNKQ